MSGARLSTGRDPFARQSVRRETVRVTHETCDWCGMRKQRTIRRLDPTEPNPTWLYRYRVDPDSGRSGYVANGRLFCSISCARSYLD